MLLMLSLFVILLLLPATELANNDKDKDQDKTCKDDLKAKKSYVGQRFSDKNLDSICNRINNWKKEKQELKPQKTHTKDQEEYVQHIRQCKGKDCLNKKDKDKDKDKNKDKEKGKGPDGNCRSTSGPKLTTRPASGTGRPGTTTRPASGTGRPGTTKLPISGSTRPQAGTTGKPPSTGTAAYLSTQESTTGQSGASSTPALLSTPESTTGPSGSSGSPLPTSTQKSTTVQFTSSGTPRPISKVIRKEYRTCTDTERQKFNAALQKLNTDTIDGETKFQLLVEDHLPSISPEAHWGCAFLPFHREFLKQLEVALRLEDADVFIPYWDSTLDQGLPIPCDSIIWSNSFMGNGKGLVTSGPFANWKTTQPAPGQNGNQLYRECGLDSGGGLFQPRDLDYIMTQTKFQDLCYCNDPTYEIAHGLVHVYVGGHMAYIPISPNDPIFWMHHAFIDKIWEDWRQAKQTRDKRETDYPPDSQSCGADYFAQAQMKPFIGLKNIDGLSNTYTDQLYSYGNRPTCPSGCTGPYLFCSSGNPPRCLSKISVGGNCTGFANSDICFGGKCDNNKCV